MVYYKNKVLLFVDIILFLLTTEIVFFERFLFMIDIWRIRGRFLWFTANFCFWWKIRKPVKHVFILIFKGPYMVK